MSQSVNNMIKPSDNRKEGDKDDFDMSKDDFDMSKDVDISSTEVPSSVILLARALSGRIVKNNPLKRTRSEIDEQIEIEDQKKVDKDARKAAKDAKEAKEAAAAAAAAAAAGEPAEAKEPEEPEEEIPYLKGIEKVLVRNAMEILKNGWKLQGRLEIVYNRYLKDISTRTRRRAFWSAKRQGHSPAVSPRAAQINLTSTEMPEVEHPSCLVVVHPRGTKRLFTRVLEVRPFGGSSSSSGSSNNPVITGDPVIIDDPVITDDPVINDDPVITDDQQPKKRSKPTIGPGYHSRKMRHPFCVFYDDGSYYVITGGEKMVPSLQWTTLQSRFLQQYEGAPNRANLVKRAAHFNRTAAALCGDTTAYATVNYVNPQTGIKEVVPVAVILSKWAAAKAEWYKKPVIKNGASKAKVAADSIQAKWWGAVTQYADECGGSFPVFVPPRERCRSFLQGHADIAVEVKTN